MGRSATRGVTGTWPTCSRLSEPCQMDRILCIVSRQHPELFAYLQYRFRESIVTVILDRRVAARRQESQAVPQERRREERRRRPQLDAHLKRHSPVIVPLGGPSWWA